MFLKSSPLFLKVHFLCFSNLFVVVVGGIRFVSFFVYLSLFYLFIYSFYIFTCKTTKAIPPAVC